VPEAEEKESGDRAEKKIQIRPRRVSEEEQARKERVKVRCFFSSDQAHYIYPSTPSSDSTERRQAFFHCRFFLIPHQFSAPVAFHCAESRGGAFAAQFSYGGRSAARKTRRRGNPPRGVSVLRETQPPNTWGVVLVQPPSSCRRIVAPSECLSIFHRGARLHSEDFSCTPVRLAS